MKRSRAWIGLLLILVLMQAVALAVLLTRREWQRQALDTPVARGRELARELGCFGCHGPGGERPIPNPGAKNGEVPRWGGGMWMMYNDDEADVRGWIRDGRPSGHEPDENALIPMPAYGERVDDGELSDLTSYVLAVSRFGWPAEPGVAEGREVAERFGCFGCHGPEGRGLVLNPGSLKGYIPPWDGPDYPELVRDEEEFRQWVRDGIPERLRSNPAARTILETQAIGMPAYGDRITADELDALLAYVEWVRENPR
ncbi:MAG: c-type cytochrome [Acidobacteriota bacterium]|jgi:mono/diheme cytochrome c family protein